MDWLQHIIQPLSLWLHVIGTALLVGGTLFYEFVVPQAIEDLKAEQQLSVLGKVRWVFRQVVLFSALVMMITGVQQLLRYWIYYTDTQKPSAPWAFLHIGTGLVALLIALRVTTPPRVPRRPIGWMRVNFVLLLVCAFFASTTRHVRLTLSEQQDAAVVGSPWRTSTTRPAVLPPASQP